MYKEAMRAAWAEINLSNLDYNIKQVKKHLAKSNKISAVIKADAYGHGAAKVAGVLRANDITSFGVATLSEAVRLRNSGFILEEIIILGPTPDPLIEPIIEHRLSPVVSSYDNAEAISKAAAKQGIIISGYLAIDTGMGRIGFNSADLTTIEDIKMINSLPNFNILGVISHLANAEEENSSYSSAQTQRFLVYVKELEKSGVKVRIRSLANSAALSRMQSTHFEMTRPGIILYGINALGDHAFSSIQVKPVMSIKANIIELRKVSKGTSIGPGRKFIAKEDSIIATIPIGYADGLSKSFSKKGKVIVNGVFAPIAGSISMDMAMIDVTHVPYVRLGDEVTIMGTDGMAELGARDIAAATNTIPEEVLCGFGTRLPKVYTY